MARRVSRAYPRSAHDLVVAEPGHLESVALSEVVPWRRSRSKSSSFVCHRRPSTSMMRRQSQMTASTRMDRVTATNRSRPHDRMPAIEDRGADDRAPPRARCGGPRTYPCARPRALSQGARPLHREPEPPGGTPHRWKPAGRIGPGRRHRSPGPTGAGRAARPDRRCVLATGVTMNPSHGRYSRCVRRCTTARRERPDPCNGTDSSTRPWAEALQAVQHGRRVMG